MQVLLQTIPIRYVFACMYMYICRSRLYLSVAVYLLNKGSVFNN